MQRQLDASNEHTIAAQGHLLQANQRHAAAANAKASASGNNDRSKRAAAREERSIAEHYAQLCSMEQAFTGSEQI